VYAMVNRLIWITDKKFLGGNFGMDLLIPFVRTDLKIGALGVADQQFGMGDLYLEPFVLAWHGPRYDAAVGLSFFLPTGQYSKTEPASAGQDFTTTMLTFGYTFYLDPAKAWSLSVLGRYEINGEKGETKVKPGHDLVLEWGLAKNVAKVWDIGLSGYYIGQLTDDSGAAAVWDTSVHDRVFAIGPEVSAFIVPAKMFLSVRSLWETGAKDRSQGHSTCITLTKIF
ncbi:MAG: transporter, partial [Candidatus Glassbacteria bacterium]